MISNLHQPIMVQEILSKINFENNNFFLDATYGGGGHSDFILDKGSMVLAIDNYEESKKIAYENKFYGTKLEFYKNNFKNIDEIIIKNNIIKKFDGVILDLGFSSNQLADDKVGISFKKNIPLSMNYADYDNSAFDIINNYSEKDLAYIFKEYGEINSSNKLARHIISSRKQNKIYTTFDFIEIIKNSGVHFGSKKINFATKPFQAIRIEANKELENLSIFLSKINDHLNKNALIFIISFHSLEDRIVKKYFKNNAFLKNLTFQNKYNWGYKILTKRPITPSKEELTLNPRSRSAKLRIAEYIC